MVYVDDARIGYGRMKMSHMLADTPDELHAMAQRIGVARRHYQLAVSAPHYDICVRARADALEFGAKAVQSRDLVPLMRAIRATRVAAVQAGQPDPWA